MHKLIACTSYTGSAGCSVSTLNIAYHLARNGSNVCVLDLDLASPTLGAAAGLADVAAGADPGIHHHLGGYIAPENISDIERDVWTSPHIRSSRRAGFGTFKLVPGTSGAGDFVLGAGQAVDLLGRALDDVAARFDYVFCDLPAGVNAAFDLFSSDPTAKKLFGWLLFARRTPAHLKGVQELRAALKRAHADDPCLLHIQTAVMDAENLPDDARERTLQSLGGVVSLESAARAPDEPHTVSWDPALHFCEAILANPKDGGGSSEATIEEFRKIAAAIDEMEAA